MKRMAFIILTTLNLTGCLNQRIWFWETMADQLDPQPIEQVDD